MSSFEKAGVLFITGLVAVILALALFGTSGTTEKATGAGGGAEVAELGPDESAGQTQDEETISEEAENLWDGVLDRANQLPRVGVNGGGGAPAPVDLDSGTRPPLVVAREPVVRSGDRLANIAKQYLGDANRWNAIAEANPGVDPSRLKVGQRLVIPDRSATAASSRADMARTTPPSPLAAEKKPTYVVKKGDTLTSIAQRELRNGAAWRKLYDMNKHVVKNANRLPVGVTLTLPAN